MNENNFYVPDDWYRLIDVVQGDLVLVVGDTDTGKTTLIHWLRKKLASRGTSPALLDGDPGQSRLGAPASITITDDDSRVVSWFIGSNTPRGHMLSILTGARRLIDEVHFADTLLYDTTGLIDQSAGGFYLKLSIIDLLQPDTILAFQQQNELEGLLKRFKQDSNVRLIELTAPERIKPKTISERANYRRCQFREYFKGSNRVQFLRSELTLWPVNDLMKHRLLGFCNSRGFLKDLGIIELASRNDQKITVQTPLSCKSEVNHIRTGDLLVNPETFEDRKVS